MRNVVLCGFMGCGKTTVGRQLAALSGRRFVDMDEYIEQQAGMAVSEIFRQYGEDDFRRRERETCRALAGQTGLVIARGRRRADLCRQRGGPAPLLRHRAAGGEAGDGANPPEGGYLPAAARPGG